jgi:hypothetical protein
VIILHASLPAKSIYLKRGYREEIIMLYVKEALEVAKDIVPEEEFYLRVN